MAPLAYLAYVKVTIHGDFVGNCHSFKRCQAHLSRQLVLTEFPMNSNFDITPVILHVESKLKHWQFIPFIHVRRDVMATALAAELAGTG